MLIKILELNNINYHNITDNLIQFELNNTIYFADITGKITPEIKWLLLMGGMPISGNIGNYNFYALIGETLIHKIPLYPEEIYSFFQCTFPLAKSYFIESLSLADIYFTSISKRYILLPSTNYINIMGCVGIEIKSSNIFKGKSIYLYNGNEIKNLEELNLIRRSNILWK